MNKWDALKRRGGGKEVEGGSSRGGRRGEKN